MPDSTLWSRRTLAILFAIAMVLCDSGTIAASPDNRARLSAMDDGRLTDGSDGVDWAAYGRTYGEQHYSPLTQINARTVGRLGLAWSMDLPRGNPATIPLEVGGTLFFASGLNIVHALDAASGRSLWTYDPKVAQAAGHKLRQGWGSRGIGYWNGKIYTGTGDGRLIALDAKTGRRVWSVMTVDPGDGRYITGAPRLFDGKVIIGHGGADSASTRGYVTAYDAETGQQIWRFYTVPGNPADGFEDKAQAQAAKTWAGEWWKYGGGGTAWNAFTYDTETHTILIGTGNGAPWNRRVRSQDRGDNLFLCSIVALDAATGAYKWHYQINPGESWDYNAAMDMHLADLTIAGRPRKVIITAPKNGFLYVIDRLDGRLISATPIAKITWATGIDPKDGRPIEAPEARYPHGKPFELWPSNVGAHSWMPSAFSPKAGLVYVPLLERGAVYSDAGVDPATWTRAPGNAEDFAVSITPVEHDPLANTSWLLAFDPVARRARWKQKTASAWNGGILATGGDLVFQGQLNGEFDAYEASSGRKLWRYAAQAPIIAAPISYAVGGRQFVTVIVGMGTSPGGVGPIPFDYYSQARRVLTFRLGGSATIPIARPTVRVAPPDTDYRADAAVEARGAGVYYLHCVGCHGVGAISGGQAPDLRFSSVPLNQVAFAGVVHAGALVDAGMPRFEELSDTDLDALRQYLRAQSAAARAQAAKSLAER
jgi:quinohemoprotein ethanol dehydrogenase